MILNHKIQHNNNATEETALIFIHGLFGSLSNLGMIARAFYESHTVIQVDLRNHGHSSHSSEMNYRIMAQDILETLDSLNIQKTSVIGHSMGGKIAMQLVSQAVERIEKVVILDIAPVSYIENQHNQIFKALYAVKNANIKTRLEATKIMREYFKEEMVIQFLMKSFDQDHWLFNIDALFNHYLDISGWKTIHPCAQKILFIRGELSPYISQDKHFESITEQFPHAQIKVIENVGHWLHAEKPQQVIDEINDYLKDSFENN